MRPVQDRPDRGRIRRRPSMGWWSWEYLPSMWDSGDEATGPQMDETITVGRFPADHTVWGAPAICASSATRRRHILVTHTADSGVGHSRLP
jgi:hypothetical protein